MNQEEQKTFTKTAETTNVSNTSTGNKYNIQNKENKITKPKKLDKSKISIFEKKKEDEKPKVKQKKINLISMKSWKK